MLVTDPYVLVLGINVFPKSESETIPKPTTCLALGKQKIRSVERGYLSHYRNSMKNCFLAQN